MHPECAVRAIILNSKGEILLIRSAIKWQGQYVCPGGRVELYECLEDAVKREVREEVGLEIRVGPFIGLQEDITFPNTNGIAKHLIFLDYLCYCKDTNVHIDGVEAQEYLWIIPVEALKVEVTGTTRDMIRSFMVLWDIPRLGVG